MAKSSKEIQRSETYRTKVRNLHLQYSDRIRGLEKKLQMTRGEIGEMIEQLRRELKEEQAAIEAAIKGLETE